jgi:CDP-paratose 2-epimerase
MNFEHIFITGGAGFIGCNFADELLTEGHTVTVFDNLSRAGAALNLEWLDQRHRGPRFRFVQGDLRDSDGLRKAMAGAEVVYHLAAQTAVTTSIAQPREDFEINALGTLNVLEAARQTPVPPIIVYASTNKVYGALDRARVIEDATRYVLPDQPDGIDEQWPLDFHSPYGCSKGAADQYVRDYARIYGLRTVVMRQSCIYGQRQFGVEDQGWVAWFAIAAILGRPITVFGNGKQVRDLLHVKDLAQAWRAAVANIDATAGRVYNLGGGVLNAISIWSEFGALLSELVEHEVTAAGFAGWRSGDQPVFICDTRQAQADFAWQPTTSVRTGVADLVKWISGCQDTILAAFDRR